MSSNTVEINTRQQPSRLLFAPRFNVAVPFIDRHVVEGRGAKTAIRTIQGDVSYAQLAANIDRCAVALMRLGLRRGERVLMIVKDCPVFFICSGVRSRQALFRSLSTHFCGAQATHS